MKELPSINIKRWKKEWEKMEKKIVLAEVDVIPQETERLHKPHRKAF